jgi:4-hydroxy-3-methylbut-2-enyl diphosphate reductase
MADIEIDPQSGFCFGVVTAINKAEEELAKGEPMYCLGDIVHNNAEVERLRAKGLTTIDHDEMRKLHGVKVLLRAHGEPPSTYADARANSIKMIDATCPVVLKLQQRIKAAYDASRASNQDLQIVIYGRIGHAEVNGLVGQTDGTALVIEGIEQLDKIDFSRDISLYSQTTKSLEGFSAIIAEIERRVRPGVKFEYSDTICRQVANRVEHLREFAAAHDVVLFVAGEKSSNGKILFSHCKEVNNNAHLVANPDMIDRTWLERARTIGICGATSTPRWLMEEVASRANEICNHK